MQLKAVCGTCGSSFEYDGITNDDWYREEYTRWMKVHLACMGIAFSDADEPVDFTEIENKWYDVRQENSVLIKSKESLEQQIERYQSEISKLCERNRDLEVKLAGERGVEPTTLCLACGGSGGLLVNGKPSMCPQCRGSGLTEIK